MLQRKLNSEGHVDLYNARLVSKEFSQRIKVDYSELYAPFARYKTMLMLLAPAAHNGWELLQLHVRAALLKEPLEELYL